MGRKTEPRLTSRERLTRGLRYTAVGPVDLTRGVVGIGVHSAESTAARLHRRYEKARVQPGGGGLRGMHADAHHAAGHIDRTDGGIAQTPGQALP